MATITAGQCRAARALLGWSQRDLEVRARVSRKAIADFEREASAPYQRTIRDIVETLEAAGVMFQAPQEGIIGAGVALKWGVEPKLGLPQGDDASGKPGEGLSSAPWEDDFERAEATPEGEPLSQDILDQREYWAAYPERWAKLSDISKLVLTRELRL